MVGACWVVFVVVPAAEKHLSPRCECLLGALQNCQRSPQSLGSATGVVPIDRLGQYQSGMTIQIVDYRMRNGPHIWCQCVVGYYGLEKPGRWYGKVVVVVVGCCMGI